MTTRIQTVHQAHDFCIIANVFHHVFLEREKHVVNAMIMQWLSCEFYGKYNWRWKYVYDWDTWHQLELATALVSIQNSRKIKPLNSISHPIKQVDSNIRYTNGVAPWPCPLPPTTWATCLQPYMPLFFLAPFVPLILWACSTTHGWVTSSLTCQKILCSMCLWEHQT